MGSLTSLQVSAEYFCYVHKGSVFQWIVSLLFDYLKGHLFLKCRCCHVAVVSSVVSEMFGNTYVGRFRETLHLCIE